VSAHWACSVPVVDAVTQGFNYAYRRTASNNLAPTPGSSTVNLPSNNVSHPPTKVSTPVPDRPTPPHLANNKITSTIPQISGKLTTRDSATTPEDKSTGSQSVALDRGEKDRLKRERKKEKRERERAEKDSIKDAAEEEQASISGKDTPISPVSDSALKSVAAPADDMPSPAESNGTRTPTSRKPARNPWTLFLRMQIGATEEEIREFFREHAAGVGLANCAVSAILKYLQIIRVNYPQSHTRKAQKIVYVEFGDEGAMKAALEGHAEVSEYLLDRLARALMFFEDAAWCDT
jgi:hypothetical protein